MARFPFLTIGRRGIRRFLRLPDRRRRDLLRAAVWLLAVDLGLRTFGFAPVRRRLRDLARRADGRSSRARDGDEREEAEALAWGVAAASRHHIYPMRCLARSLVLQTLLARRGISSELRIGVQTGEEGLRAHAWVEHDGRPLAERENPAESFGTLDLPSS